MALRADSYVEEAMRWLPAGHINTQPGKGLSAHQSDIGLFAGQREGGRILLADDNTDMGDYVCRLLKQRFEVTAVANGKEALESALANPPDSGSVQKS
jgi:PleD family two-component response regulator